MKTENGVPLEARLGDLLVSTPPWNAVTLGLFVCLSGRGYGSDSDVIHDDSRRTIAKNGHLSVSRPPLAYSPSISYSMLARVLVAQCLSNRCTDHDLS